MKILIDTNVVLDVLLMREPFCEDAVKILGLTKRDGVKEYVSASAVTDIYSREQRAKCLLADIWRLPRGSNTPLLCNAASLIPRCLQRGL